MSAQVSKSNVRVVPEVLAQHVEDAIVLHSTRQSLVTAPHVKLHHLRRFDDRVAAHLDGLRIAGDAAKSLYLTALETPSAAAVFVACVGALTAKDTLLLQQLIALAEAMRPCATGISAAFAWVRPDQLQGVVADLLRSGRALERHIGVAACAVHRTDPGLATGRYFDDPEPLVRARAFRAAGELGKREFLSRLGGYAGDADPTCGFWAAWSAVLLGNRQDALQQLIALGKAPTPFNARAFQLSLLAMPSAHAHEVLRDIAQDPSQTRRLIAGTGLVGDPAYINWLIQHMADDKLARGAGEAFSLITGADLAALDLERKPPENFQAGPNDDPNDANVAMDEDESLPWPDAERIGRWWTQHSSRFVSGRRYFVGAPLTREHCIEILRTGYQRQRILAAHHLCLLEPGSVLFEWRAPAWRQAQALAALA